MHFPPRNTIRLRLTLVYAALFLVSGTGLVGMIYVLVDRSTGPLVSSIHLTTPDGSQLSPGALPPAPLPAGLAQVARAQEMHNLLVDSEIALAVMVAVAAGLGWLVAGRVLRPLRAITGSVREISAHRLHERLAVAGPQDELHELSETFNGLLDRLEAAFEAERLFVANASHELRTPLTRERTVMEVALRDREATVDSLRAAGERVLASGAQLEKLIEALLTLARSQRDLEASEPFDLSAAAAAALKSANGAIRLAAMTVATDLRPAPGHGDPRLVERLVVNLVENAIRHNAPADGWMQVTTGVRDGWAAVRVCNTGPVVPPAELERLMHPFQRLVPGRSTGAGSGLGLSIVRAITAAHDARLTVASRPEGGLEIEVRFPLDA